MLNRNKLLIEIRKISDEKFEEFEGFPESKQEAHERWSEAIKVYCEDIFPISTSFELAKKEMKNFLNINQNPNSLGDSISVFADILAMGMNPNFNGISPNINLNLYPAFFIGFSGANSKEVAEQLSLIIHNWFLTGTAINSSSGATINWN